MKNLAKDQWLLERSKGIGGSEIGTILGLNKFQTPYDLWEIKTGRSAMEINDLMQNGHYLELAISEYFEKGVGKKINKESVGNIFYVDKKNPFFIGSPDRLYDNNKVLECKSTTMNIDKDDIPMYWYAQLQWYLMLVGSDSGAIAWVSSYGGRNHFDHVFVEKDSDYIAYMREQAEKFWTKNVVKDVPPEPVNAEDVEKMYPEENKGKEVVANNEIMRLYDELIDLIEQKKQNEVRIAQIKDYIKQHFGDAEKMIYAGDVLFTWKKSKDSVKFDAEEFKKQKPELYKQFLKQKKGSRRFLIK
jgi:putative phage-type endonuclease